MALFSGSSFYLHGDFSSVAKEELRSVIERNGGKVTIKITTKTSHVVCSAPTKDLHERAKTQGAALLNENYIMECINARKRLPTSGFQHKMERKRSRRADTDTDDDSNVYNFATSSSDDSKDKENYINKIRDKLKKISLKSNNKREKEFEMEVDETLLMTSCKKLKMITSRDDDDGDGKKEWLPPLKNLVFYIYGAFSIPLDVVNSLILDNGGSVSGVVDNKVTHFLFGGESVDIPEFHEAQRLKIHIVNEYFLRLLVKY